MEEVANWIVENLPFDRLYLYGRNRPIHVSYGPENSRLAYRMEFSKGGIRMPRPWNKITRTCAIGQSQGSTDEPCAI